MRRECRSCYVEKDIKEFYDKEGGKFGKHSSCKKCLKSKNKYYRQRFPDKIKIKDKIYRQTLMELYADESFKSHVRLPEKSAFGFEIYAKRKMHALASSILNYGIRLGYINKPNSCSACHKQRQVQGHHPDYSKALEVIWVCAECHGKLHSPKGI